MLYGGDWVVARSGANIAACSGGGQGPQNSATPMQRWHYDCHLFDAGSGARGGDFTFEMPASPQHVRFAFDWAAEDGWLVARELLATTSNPTTSTIELDRVSKSGVLTEAVLDVTVPATSAGALTLRTIAPNLHAIVTPKNDAAYVTLVGCSK
jgi:hypothetical protein